MLVQWARGQEEGIAGKRRDLQRHKGEATASLCDGKDTDNNEHYALAVGRFAEGLGCQSLSHGHVIHTRASPVAFELERDEAGVRAHWCGAEWMGGETEQI